MASSRVPFRLAAQVIRAATPLQHQISLQSHIRIQHALLSTSRTVRSQPKPEETTSHQRRSEQQARPDDLDATGAHLREMIKGLSPSIKFLLFAGLTIAGTAETIFYTKALWRWWKGENKDSQENTEPPK